MTSTIRSVLVHGCNGVQGGAIAGRLFEEGFQVRAGVRNLANSAPLRARGIPAVAAVPVIAGFAPGVLDALRSIDALATDKGGNA